MKPLLKGSVVAFTLAFIAAIALNSAVAAFLAFAIPVLLLVDKYLERVFPERKPEPTAEELAARQEEFEKEVKAELVRISTMTNMKTNVLGTPLGMR